MEIKYKGQTLTFSENTEKWSHPEVGKRDTLSALKSAVDDLSRKDRQLRVPAYYIQANRWSSSNTVPKVQRVMVTSIVEPGQLRSTGDPYEVWIVDENKSRSKVGIREVYPLEAKAKIDEYIKARLEVDALETKIERLFEALPRATVESLKANREAK